MTGLPTPSLPVVCTADLRALLLELADESRSSVTGRGADAPPSDPGGDEAS